MTGPFADTRPFSHIARQENLERLHHETFDLLVIGGGITGTAIARDAALRGFRTALVEKADFASGTSSRSSRLIHGGVRYLEFYRFGLVYEASTERYRLRRIAPRLISPLPFLYPVYGTGTGLLKLALGLWLYDILGLFRNVQRHRTLGAHRVARREPFLARRGLKGAVRYYDAAVDDARLTLLTAKAAHHAGAVIVNHAPVIALLRSGLRVVGAVVRDARTGQEIEVQARLVVNAAGPWADAIRRMSDNPPAMLRPTKGAHLIVPWERVPTQHAIVFDSPRDGRHLFLIPWGEFAILGTTDTDYSGDPEAVAADAWDVAYLLEAAHRAFPTARLSEADIVSTYAGLRPLIAQEAASTYAISREHHIEETAPGLLTIAGGKLTTHRLMAEELVDRAARLLAEQFGIQAAHPCMTARLRLDGTPIRSPLNWPVLTAFRPVDVPVPEKSLRHLTRTYGPEAARILAYVEENPALGQPLLPHRPYLLAEIPYAVKHEMAQTLSDFLIRRTHVIYEDRDGGLAVAPQVADRMAALLGWDEAEKARQLREYQAQVALTRAWRRGGPPGTPART